MKQLLIDILNRIKTGATLVKYSDEDTGQLDYYNPNPPVKWPCSLVDTDTVQWSYVARKKKMGLAQVKVRLANLKLSNTSGQAPAGQKEAAFSMRDVITQVVNLLHGWAGSRHYTPLLHVTEQRVKREDGVRIWELTFTTEVTDDSATPQPQKIILQPVIDTTDKDA